MKPNLYSIDDLEFPAVLPMGECSLLAIFHSNPSPEISHKILAFDSYVRSKGHAGIRETVPALRSLLIHTDPKSANIYEVEDFCKQLLAGDEYLQGFQIRSRSYRIPVVYGGASGPDLSNLCQLMRLSEREAIELHSSVKLRVICLGFSPGLTYLAELPKEYDIPRKNTYSGGVPPGSVLVANRQTVFPATEIPTGWHRIGVSPVVGFRPEKKRPFLFSPGDSICFYPIAATETSATDIERLWSSIDEREDT